MLIAVKATAIMALAFSPLAVYHWAVDQPLPGQPDTQVNFTKQTPVTGSIPVSETVAWYHAAEAAEWKANTETNNNATITQIFSYFTPFSSV